jgi:hypothetical protein
MIRKAANRFPANQPVDLELIGHSEGAVVNSQALLRLSANMPPALAAGYIRVTMLDPHAANNGVPGQQYSVARGPLGWVAEGSIDSYQSRAKDPRPVVSRDVDDVEVFYQHTPSSRAHGVNLETYNLWGQVPVHESAAAAAAAVPVHYFNLTAAGATHGGKTGVVEWYQRNVVPLLRDGAPELRSWDLSGALASASAPGGQVTHRHLPEFAGTALPGSRVWLFGGPARVPSELAVVGRTVAAPDGHWQASTRRLPDGRYRIVAVSVPQSHPAGPRLAMLPTAPLGLLVVDAGLTDRRRATP